MTVAELLKRMSSRELSEWLACDQLAATEAEQREQRADMQERARSSHDARRATPARRRG
jgi:hypothetical protein